MSYHSNHRPKAHRAKIKVVNLPSVKLSIKPLTAREIDLDIGRRLSHVNRELQSGFNFIKNHPKSVTFFGSARIKKTDKYYKLATRLAKRLSEENYSVFTGGGPGIMEAANFGAKLNEGPSLGLSIRLPEEQVTNPYVTDFREFNYFFTRKVCLTFSAEAYIYFPGGYGTLDEFYEILTLVQTRKIKPVPIILFGSDFWGPLCACMEAVLSQRFKTIDKKDLKLFHVTDDIEDAVHRVKSAPIRHEYDSE